MTSPPTPLSIFWAEDAFDDQFLIREVARGFRPFPRITFFQDGRGLLDELPSGHPDLIVLDVRMPRLDGVDTLKAIRRDPRFSELPVIMFSTALIEAEAAVCQKLGIQAYVQKPSSFDAFQAAVEGIVRGAVSGNIPAEDPRHTLALTPAG
ncbi:MAG TPA: response regulator [Candidatus Thermoplasmatota archaeon]|nr:response regulator [Candidatus Thermoplasmatota archaeon]